MNILIAATSILAFIGGGSESSDVNSIIVGCIAAFTVFWNSCDRMLNYKSRADMHAAAMTVCKELLANLDFKLIRYQSLSDEEKENPLDKQALEDIKTKLDQVQESCTSSIPVPISQLYKRMNSLVMFDLGAKGLDKADSDTIQFLRLVNVLLCSEITKSWTWPMQLPSPVVACHNTRNELQKVKKNQPEMKACWRLSEF